MESFNYYAPTEIIFGKGVEKEVATNIKKYGGTKVVVVYGSNRIIDNSLLPNILKQLDDADIKHIEIGGVVPNPHLSLCYEGIKKGITFNADFVLAIGGGSVIDTAKAIGHGIKNPDIDIWDFYIGKEVLTKSTPVGVLLTLSAAGSEMSNSSVITNTDTMQKRGLSSDLNRPKFALMNPEFTYTIPKEELANGIVDIMMHTLDRYFTINTVNSITDKIAEAVLKNTIEFGKIAYENQTDYKAMSELMWTSSLSHNGITGLGQPQDFAPHGLAHEYSAKFNLAHGKALSVVWGAWATYTYKTNPARFAQYGKNVWNIDEADTEKSALMAINTTVEFFKSLNMPTCLSDANIPIQSEEELQELGFKCVYEGKRKLGNFVQLEQNDCTEIYRLTNK